MRNLYEIQSNNVNSLTAFKSSENDASTAYYKTKELPNDRVEISANKKDLKKSDYGGIAAITGVIAAVACGGVFGGKRIYQKYANELICGIKRGEIKDEFFDFIKKNDKKCEYFNQREKVLELQSHMDDEKFLLMKKLFKLKSDYDVIGKRGTTSKDRKFTFQELSDLLQFTNKDNIGYLEQLANIKGKVSEYSNYEKSLNADEIKDFIMALNKDNTEIAQQVIDKFDIIHNKPSEMADLLKNANKDNVEIYKMLFNSRKSGKNTALSYKEMTELANLISGPSGTNNPQCAELFLNLRKGDGTESFILNDKTLRELLRCTTDNKIELYRKLTSSDAVMGFREEDLIKIFENSTEENAEGIVKLSGYKGGSSNHYAYTKADDLLEAAGLYKNLDNNSKEILDLMIASEDSYCVDVNEVKEALLQLQDKKGLNTEHFKKYRNLKYTYDNSIIDLSELTSRTEFNLFKPKEAIELTEITSTYDDEALEIFNSILEKYELKSYQTDDVIKIATLLKDKDKLLKIKQKINICDDFYDLNFRLKSL